MKVAHFEFAPGLQPLLQRELRDKQVTIRFQGSQTVKHLVESLGIPHTEIGLLKANGRSIRSDYVVLDEDRIEVQPVSPMLSTTEEPRFVLDGHLGRLASHLRMLGLDCLYQPDFDDTKLVEISLGQARILLTRDRRLLMHKIITHGTLVRSLYSTEQLHEVVYRYSLVQWIKPFQRCLRCNHPLEYVEKESILEKLEPLTKKYYDEFKVCLSCDQVYWKGSHYERMLELIENVSTSF